MCVCVCVCERERERESLCVRVCVCVKERERGRERKGDSMPFNVCSRGLLASSVVVSFIGATQLQTVS